MILVTGGAGYLGSHLVLNLLREGNTVIVYDNLMNSTLDNLNTIINDKYNGGRSIFIHGDTRDQNALRTIFTQYKITDVIHLAGLKSVRDSVFNKELYHDINVEGSRNVFELAFRYNVQSIIFSSTAALYKYTEHGRYSETDLVDASNNPYSQNKIDAENILKNLKIGNPSINCTILRYFNPVGTDWFNPLPLSLINNQNLFPNILMNMVNKTPLSIYGNDYGTPDGTAVRDYIHITDLMNVHKLILDNYLPLEHVRVFNVGTGQGYSTKEIIDTFNLISQTPVDYNYVPRRPGDASISVADNTKVRNALGWEPRFTLADMVMSSLSSVP